MHGVVQHVSSMTLHSTAVNAVQANLTGFLLLLYLDRCISSNGAGMQWPVV